MRMLFKKKSSIRHFSGKGRRLRQLQAAKKRWVHEFVIVSFLLMSEGQMTTLGLSCFCCLRFTQFTLNYLEVLERI